MNETTNMTTGSGAGGEYYRAYYRALVTTGQASRAERNRRLEAIKSERRRARREKWLKEIKSLAGVLVSPEAAG